MNNMEYDASHKASSVTSTTSNSSIWDPLPSLYTGRADSVSSAYELDDLQEPEPFEGFSNYPSALKKDLLIDNNEQQNFSEFLNSFFKEEENVVKEEVIDHEVPSSSNLCHGDNSNSRKRPLPVEQEDEDQLLKNRELLSEDQKRANHIASEQKRRNTIRGGFKELTEIIPTLKNINNSKSTILFNSVDYIKQLDKRNKSLRDRLALLQSRVQQKRIQKKPSNQQKQLELLQQQLRVQQALLTKHNIPLYSNSYHSISIPAMDDTPVTSAATSPTLPHASLVNNNNNHQHQQHIHHYQHQQNTYTTPAALVIPADEWSHASAPSFNIPADEHDSTQSSSFRERLLSSGKLNHLKRKGFSSSPSPTYML